MSKFQNLPYGWRRFITYSLVALISVVLTTVFFLAFGSKLVVNYSSTGNFSQSMEKLENVYKIIQEQYIGDANEKNMIDAAAWAMVQATGDKWSYYMTADEYAAYLKTTANANAGIGVKINSDQMEKGILVETVDPDGGAAAAGIQVGDWITHVEGEAISAMSLSDAQNKIRGQSGTTVKLTINRNGTSMELVVSRGMIAVAKGQMLENGIGLVTIVNFNEKCCDETVKAINDLKSQGAKGLIFDVRGNPGGSSQELVSVLDYLLPKDCVLFRSESYDGKKEVAHSTEGALDMPIAVLINAESYSAAELFAATLVEYDKAFTVGQHTTGKGRYQINIPLSDGSAVHLSVGRYCTPKGVDLGEAGGIAPTHAVELSKAQADKFAEGELLPKDDPQVQKAMEELLKKMK